MSVFRRAAPPREDRGGAHLASLITERAWRDPDMPPRPQQRSTTSCAEDWWDGGFGAGRVSSIDPEFDPCGAGPIRSEAP